MSSSDKLNLIDLANKFCPEFGAHNDCYAFWKDTFIRDVKALIQQKCDEQKRICESQVTHYKIQTEVKADILKAPYPAI